MGDSADKPSGRGQARQWRIDLKWVFGIPFTLVLFFTLLVLAMFQITGEENATPTLASMKTPLLSDAKIQSDLNQRFPQIAATLNDPDFVAKVYADPAVLDQAIKTLPDPAALEAQAAAAGESTGVTNEEEDDSGANGMRSLLSLFKVPVTALGSGAHETFGQALTLLLIALVLTGVPFILLSRRGGRFVSPAISLVFASWIPLLLLTGIKAGFESMLEGRQAEATSSQDLMIVDVIRPLSDGVFGKAISVYTLSATVGGVLMLLAAVFFLVTKIVSRRRKSAAVGRSAIPAS